MKKSYFPPLDLGWVFQTAAGLALIIIFVIQWGRMIVSPSLRTGTDFIAFYTAGRIAQDHGFSSVYDIDRQQHVQQTLVGFELAEGQVLLYNHVPYLLPFLYLLVDEDYAASFVRWDLLMLAGYVAGSLFFLKGILPSDNNNIRRPLIWGALTFVPFFHSLILGQDTALLFLGISLWCLGILRKQNKTIVAGLVLATVRPHICLALALPLIFRNRRAWWLFVLSAGLFALANTLLVGLQGTLGFIQFLQISAGGTWYGMNEQAMLNLSGLVLRIFPAIQPEALHLLRWAAYLAGILILCVTWIKWEHPGSRLLGISIIVALLFAPHLHFHDLTLLVIPLVFAATRTGQGIPPERMALLPLGISLLLIAGSLHYVTPYILYAGLAWWLARNPAPNHISG